MRMRRGWAGLVGVLSVLAAGACNPAKVGPGGSGIEEDTLAALPRTCPAPATVRATPITVEIPANNGRVVRLPGEGRNHTLTIWGSRASNRTIVVNEMERMNGVEIKMSPAPEPGLAWGVVTLDASGCEIRGAPFIVKRHDDGVLTRPGGGYDSASVSAFAVLRGNSGYMLATPD